jgi:hypothetical protein
MSNCAQVRNICSPSSSFIGSTSIPCHHQLSSNLLEVMSIWPWPSLGKNRTTGKLKSSTLSNTKSQLVLDLSSSHSFVACIINVFLCLCLRNRRYTDRIKGQFQLRIRCTVEFELLITSDNSLSKSMKSATDRFFSCAINPMYRIVFAR